MGVARRRRGAQHAAAGAEPRRPRAGDFAGLRGVLRLVLIDQLDAIPLLAAALAGDRRADLYLVAVNKFLRWLRQPPPDDPQLCLTCDRALSVASCATIAFLHAERDDLGTAAVFGRCVRCRAADRDAAAAEAAVQQALRRIWPDLRLLPPASPSGRA